MRHTKSSFPDQKVSNLQGKKMQILSSNPFSKFTVMQKKLIHPYHVVIQANLEKKLRVKNKRTTGKRKRREKLSWGWGQREILKLC